MKSCLRFLLRWLFSLRLTGLPGFVFNGPALVMPNHISFLDAVFLYAHLPEDTWFVVNHVMAGRFWWLWKLGICHLEVDPFNPYSLRMIIRVVREGRPVVLFPEGRITRTGGLMKIYGGIGLVVAKTGAMIHPVILQGLEFSKVSRMKGILPLVWLPKVRMHIGEPVRLKLAEGVAFRRQKKMMGDLVLRMLQENLFAAKQAGDGGSNLFGTLREAAALYGGSRKIVADGMGEISYRKLLFAIYVMGNKLRSMLADQQTLGVLLPNSVGHVVVLFALFYLGKVPAILNFSNGGEGCRICGNTAGVQVILTSRTFIRKGKLEELAERLGADFSLIYLEDVKGQIRWWNWLASLWSWLWNEKGRDGGKIILFTSGSEGAPKGVVLQHRQILANVHQIASVIDYTPRDKMLNALPMFHSFGLTAGTLLPLISGVSVFLYPSPLHYKMIPEVAYDKNATILLGTPTFLHGYGQVCHPYDFYSMRYVLAGGEKLREETRQLWQEKFGLRILEGYGTTETAPVLSLNTPLFYCKETVGRFLPGIEWRLENIPGMAAGGNLWVKGPNVMEGYLLFQRGFQAAGEWYNCGDVVDVDRDGFIRILARLKRFVKVSGEMVSLDQMERAAEQCFGTQMNAAVGLADGRRGEKVYLYTVGKEASRQRLRAYLQRVGGSMLLLPAKIITVEQLPFLGSGKVDYMMLQRMAEKENG